MMVARIAPEPIATSLSVPQFRTRTSGDGSDSTPPAALPPSLPPVLEPVPTPVPGPAIVPPSEAFAASQVVETLPVVPPSLSEVRLRVPTTWQAPASSLQLTDRRV